jgi:hypothetical protein
MKAALKLFLAITLTGTPLLQASESSRGFTTTTLIGSIAAFMAATWYIRQVMLQLEEDASYTPALEYQGNVSKEILDQEGQEKLIKENVFKLDNALLVTTSLNENESIRVLRGLEKIIQSIKKNRRYLPENKIYYFNNRPRKGDTLSITKIPKYATLFENPDLKKKQKDIYKPPTIQNIR